MLWKLLLDSARSVTVPISDIHTDPSMFGVDAGSCAPGSEPCANNPNDIQDAYVPEGGDQRKHHQAGAKDQLQGPAGMSQKSAACSSFIRKH